MKSNTSPKVAVIGDLVGSRGHTSRRDVQESLVGALQVANDLVPSLQPLEPTIGDEFQSVHEHLGEALLATVLVRLALPEHLDARCGVGVGPIEIVGASAYGLTQDGPAWWAAREAVDEVKGAQRAMPYLRTRIQRPDESPAESPDESTVESTLGAGGGQGMGLVNAYLGCRDHIVSGFDGRQRRIALGVLSGRSAAQIADDEGISASAVSQRIRGSGIRALTESIAQLDPGRQGRTPAGVPGRGRQGRTPAGVPGRGRQDQTQ